MIQFEQKPSWLLVLCYWIINPFFYISITISVLGFLSCLLHALWGFTLGSAVGLVALVVGGWIAGAIVDHFRVPVIRMDTWTRLKTVFFLVFFSFVYVGLVMLMVQQLRVFLAPGARDPVWSQFPVSCRIDAWNPPRNCVRAGLGVPNATAAFAQPVIEVPLFRARLEDGVAGLKTIMLHANDFHDCHLINEVNNETEHFLHWRCLTPFMGYPDDLAVRLACHEEHIQMWFHSQSRLERALWDHGVNDARVRLIMQYAQFPASVPQLFAAKLHTNQSCATKRSS